LQSVFTIPREQQQALTDAFMKESIDIACHRCDTHTIQHSTYTHTINTQQWALLVMVMVLLMAMAKLTLNWLIAVFDWTIQNDESMLFSQEKYIEKQPGKEEQHRAHRMGAYYHYPLPMFAALQTPAPHRIASHQGSNTTTRQFEKSDKPVPTKAVRMLSTLNITSRAGAGAEVKAEDRTKVTKQIRWLHPCMVTRYVLLPIRNQFYALAILPAQCTITSLRVFSSAKTETERTSTGTGCFEFFDSIYTRMNVAVQCWPGNQIEADSDQETRTCEKLWTCTDQTIIHIIIQTAAG
jgi:hypothetical protein